MAHEDQFLRELVAVFGERITAVEVERNVVDGPRLKVRVELLNLSHITHAYVDGRGFAYGPSEGDPAALSAARERSRVAGLS